MLDGFASRHDARSRRAPWSKKRSWLGMPGFLKKNPSFQEWISESFRKGSNSTRTESSGDERCSEMGQRSVNASLDFEEGGGTRQYPNWEQIGRRQLTLLPLAAIIFYEVCGGPFGIEESISYGGPLPVIIGLVVLPLVWSIPEALISAELSTMFPEDSGYVAWVTAAFGPFWGFMEGFCSWVSGVLDNSIYPLYAVMYMKWIFPQLEDPFTKRYFFLLTSAVLTFWNFMGLSVVGRSAVFLAIFVMVPFAVMTFWAIPKMDFGNLLIFDSQSFSKDYMKFLHVMFWNLNYWDSASSLAGEVKNPGTTIPRSFGLAVIMVILTYLLPVLVGVGMNGTIVKDGYFAETGKQVGGAFLGGWITLSALASQIGLFEAEMSSDAFLILGMSERGFLPKFMGVRSQYGTPTVGILMSSFGFLIMLISFSFEDVIELLNYAYCLGICLEFAAFLYLRVKAPNAARPYKIPLTTPQCALMLLPAMALISTILVFPWVKRDTTMISFNVVLIMAGVGFYHLLNRLREAYPYAFNPLEQIRIPESNPTEEEGNEEAQHLFRSSSSLRSS